MDFEKQKQRILSNQMYNDLTSELVKAKEETVFLTNEYNATFGKPQEVRENILKKILKSMGTDIHFEPNVRFEFGYNISIGNHFYANIDCIMLDGGGIEIGDNTIIGSGSVVTKDIPSNVIAAGVPCKVIRPITDKDKTGYQPY